MPQTTPNSCTGSVDDIIDFYVSDSAEDCTLLCTDTAGCIAYTWWNQSTPFQNTCFLYAACDDLLPCTGCTTGIILVAHFSHLSVFLSILCFSLTYLAA